MMKRRLLLWTMIAVAATALYAEKRRDIRNRYGEYKIVAVLNQTTRPQYLRSTFSLDDMRPLIRQAWRKGYDLKQLQYANGRWIGLFEKTRKATHQTYIVAPRWKAVDAAIDKYWSKGYDATHLAYGLGKWAVVFEKGTGYSDQAYERRKNRDDFVQEVRRRWKEGYDLIDMSYGEGRYTGLFAKKTGLKDQALIVRDYWYDTMKAISAYWKKGYRVADIEFMLGRWTVLFNRYDHTVEQRYETVQTNEALSALLRKAQKQGFGIVDLAEGW